MRARLYLVVAATPKYRREAVERNETAKRARNVGVRSRLSVQQQSPESALHKKPGEINRPEGAVFRQKKIETDDFPTRRGDAADFADAGFQMREIAQTVPDEYAIEERVGEGKAGGIRANNAALASRTSPFEHGQSEIDGKRFRRRRMLGDEVGKISGTARQVKDPGIFIQRRAKNGIAFPTAVHAARESVGNKVISRGNSAEHPAHELRVVFFRRRFHVRAGIVSDAKDRLGPAGERIAKLSIAVLPPSVRKA